MTSRRLPNLVAHADWSTSPGKRWMAIGQLSGSRSYRLEAPVLAGDTGSLLARLREQVGAAEGPGTLLIGFDFPIGLPRAYAKRAGIECFLDVLPRLRTGLWKDLYEVAALPAGDLARPAVLSTQDRRDHPRSPRGRARRLRHVGSPSQLRSESAPCVDACSILWTLGGKQVGRATISGWRDVLVPALRHPDLDVAIWPFDGELDELLRARRRDRRDLPRGGLPASRVQASRAGLEQAQAMSIAGSRASTCSPGPASVGWRCPGTSSARSKTGSASSLSWDGAAYGPASALPHATSPTRRDCARGSAPP